MKYTTDKEGNLIFDVSAGFSNSSQRNNIYVDKVLKKSTALVACNATSMGMGLEYTGWSIPQKYLELKQQEDNLIKFCQEDSIVLDYYKKTLPAMYAAWLVRAKDCYAPNEVHDVLSYAINMYMGSKVTYFKVNTLVSEIVSDISIRNLPIVMSGKFAGFGHVVCLVGFKAKKEFLEGYNKTKTITEDLLKFIYEWTIDDPYGDFRNDYKIVLSGNNIPMTSLQFNTMFNPRESTTVKFAHRFNKPPVKS